MIRCLGTSGNQNQPSPRQIRPAARNSTLSRRRDHPSAMAMFAKRIMRAVARWAVSERPFRPMDERAGVAVVARYAGLIERNAGPTAVVADRWRGALEGDGHGARIARLVSRI